MAFASLAQRFAVKTADTAGGAVTYRECAGTRPLVLLHGIGSASGSWLRQLAALDGARRVLAWDAPGYGGSAPLAQAEPTAHDYASRLWQWLDALQVEGPVTLVGHSLGALMAAAAAVQQAARVRRLLLLAPAQGYGRADAPLREAKRRDRLAHLQALGPAGLADKRGAAMLSPAAPAELVAYVKSIMAQVHPGGYAQATHMLAEGDLERLLARVACPVIIAGGLADTITPAEAGRALAKRLGLRWMSLGEAGHACALEAADAVVRLIVEEDKES